MKHENMERQSTIDRGRVRLVSVCRCQYIYFCNTGNIYLYRRARAIGGEVKYQRIWFFAQFYLLQPASSPVPTILNSHILCVIISLLQHEALYYNFHFIQALSIDKHMILRTNTQSDQNHFTQHTQHTPCSNKYAPNESSKRKNFESKNKVFQHIWLQCTINFDCIPVHAYIFICWTM